MRRWLKRIGWTIVGIVAIGAAYVYYDRWAGRNEGERELQAVVAELDAREPGWRWEDIVRVRKQTNPGKRNAADVLLKLDAEAEKMQPWLGFNTVRLAGALGNYELAPNRPFSVESLQSIRSALDYHRPLFLILDRLEGCDENVFPFWQSRDTLLMAPPHIDYHRRAFVLLRNRALFAADTNPQESARNIRMILKLAATIGEDPFMQVQGVRMGGAMMATHGAERLLGQHQCDELVLAELQSLFTFESRFPHIACAFQGQRARTDLVMRKLADGSFEWKGAVKEFQQLGKSADPPIELDESHWQQLHDLAENHSQILTNFNRALRILDLPTEQQCAAAVALEGTISEEPRLIIARLYRPNSIQPVVLELHQNALLRCTVAAIACERFRLRSGRWPDDLEQLVPEYLEEVPIDPHTGRPMLYRAENDGRAVYSTGPDGKDDEGNLWRSRTEITPGEDYGFRLWDVAARRKPAPDPEPEELNVMPHEREEND